MTLIFVSKYLPWFWVTSWPSDHVWLTFRNPRAVPKDGCARGYCSYDIVSRCARQFCGTPPLSTALDISAFFVFDFTDILPRIEKMLNSKNCLLWISQKIPATRNIIKDMQCTPACVFDTFLFSLIIYFSIYLNKYETATTTCEWNQVNIDIIN